MKLHEEKHSVANIAAAACFPAESYAATAVNISVQRYGTQTANIELLSGNATLNLTAIKSAKRRTIRKPN